MSNLALSDNQPGRDNIWWVEPAFADNLFEASKTIPSSTWTTIVKSTSKKKGSAQAATTKWLKTSLLTKNLAIIIGPRINRFFANANKSSEKRSILHDQLKKTINLTKTSTPAVATSVLRTWCNAWITARRTQSQIGRCKFGCTSQGSRDELEHYTQCPSLIAPINGVIIPKTGIIIGSTPGEFLTFCPPRSRPGETPKKSFNLEAQREPPVLLGFA